MTWSAQTVLHNSIFSCVDAVLITVAPQCFAIWMAMVPTPEAPEWISIWLPDCICPRVRSRWYAVRKVKGIPPAMLDESLLAS